MTASAGTVTAHTSADDLVVENSASGGISILPPATAFGTIYFGNPSNNGIGRLQYDNNTNSMQMYTNSAEAMRIDSSGNVVIGTTSTTYPIEVYSFSCRPKRN